MASPYVLEFQVRDYELDQFGVVNNAVYLNYLEHTRHEFLHSIGLDAAQVAVQRRSLVLVELSVRFLAPLRSRDRFRVMLGLPSMPRARVVFDQRMVRLPEEQPVLEARAVAALLDEQGRPLRLEPRLRARLAPYVS